MTDSLSVLLDPLLKKYAELLTGYADAVTMEKVKMWALYNHIHKTMPNLTCHWNDTNSEGKVAVRALFEEIKQMNEAHRRDPL